MADITADVEHFQAAWSQVDRAKVQAARADAACALRAAFREGPALDQRNPGAPDAACRHAKEMQ